MGLREEIAKVLYVPPDIPTRTGEKVRRIEATNRADKVMPVVSAHVDAMAEVVEQQRQEIERLTRERDAALRDAHREEANSQAHADDAHKLGYEIAQDELAAERRELAGAIGEAQKREREAKEEAEKLRLYLSHAVKFSFGTDMASHAEVTRAEQNRADGDWFFRSWGPTERHTTQEAALEAALERARAIEEEM